MNTSIDAWLGHAAGISPSSGHIAIGPHGMPEPNVDAIEASPFICYAENGTDGADGTPEGDSADGTAEEPQYTQSDVERMIGARLAKQAKRFEAESTELRQRLDQLAKQREEDEEGAEPDDKEAPDLSKAEKEIRRLRRQLEERESKAQQNEQRATELEQRLQRERLSRSLSDELARANVMSKYVDRAVRLASLDLEDVTYTEDGKILATYGDLVDKPLSEIAAEWAKDNDNFLPAPKAGAGTRGPNSAPGDGRALHELSTEELLKSADRRR